METNTDYQPEKNQHGDFCREACFVQTSLNKNKMVLLLYTPDTVVVIKNI